MKTIEDVKVDINEVNELLKSKDEIKKSKLNKLKDRLKFYRDMILYLETNPNSEYLLKELDRLTIKKQTIDSQFDFWFKNSKPYGLSLGKSKSLYKKEMGVQNLDLQIKTLTYLLS